jgi:hypothetical protein
MVRNGNAGRLYAALATTAAATVNLPVFNIQHYRVLPDKRHVATVFASADTGRQFNFSQYNESVARITDGAFSILAGSLYEIVDTHVPMFRCILAANVESRDYEAENMLGFKSIAANVFQDAEDNLWRLVGDKGSQQLVQMSSDNFTSMLEARRDRNRVVASYSVTAENEDGDYVYFFNQTTAKMDYGFLIEKRDGLYVLPRRDPSKLVNILPDQIIEAAPVPHVPADEGNKASAGPRVWRTVAAGDFSAQAYIDYVRSLFGGTAYFKALEDAIKNNGMT